jgi:CheY-like chemotaxis protein
MAIEPDAKRLIAVVNDDGEVRALLADVLGADAEYQVLQYDGSGDLVAQLLASRPDLLVLDLRLGADAPRTGWDVIQSVRASAALSSVPIVLCTADLAEVRRLESELSDVAALEVLPMPFRLADLERAVADGLTPVLPLAAGGRLSW